MRYDISREELKNDALAETLEVLYHAYSEIGAQLYVVGAAARDIGLHLLKAGDPPRRTLDLDVAVMLDRWSEYDNLSEVLRRKGFEKAPEKQKFYFITAGGFKYEVDIVPFGGIAKGDMVAWPPEGNPVMSVKCFPEVMEHADTVFVDSSFQFRIASLSGQWLIKLDAWFDRHLRTRKDATDMQYILENAYVSFALASDSLPDEVSTDATAFDLTVAGAEWVASDIAKMLPPEKRKQYAEMLSDELAKRENSSLIGDLYDMARTSSFDSILKAIRRMAEILSSSRIVV